MASISITKQHRLSHRKAKDVADRLARDLHERFGLSYTWEGDDVVFQRPGLTGRMQVSPTEIRLDVKLGLLLSALKPVIEREIHAQLDTLAGKRSA
jgi:putative polyhydroxyalkanoate system protein